MKLWANRNAAYDHGAAGANGALWCWRFRRLDGGGFEDLQALVVAASRNPNALVKVTTSSIAFIWILKKLFLVQKRKSNTIVKQAVTCGHAKPGTSPLLQDAVMAQVWSMLIPKHLSVWCDAVPDVCHAVVKRSKIHVQPVIMELVMKTLHSVHVKSLCQQITLAGQGGLRFNGDHMVTCTWWFQLKVSDVFWTYEPLSSTILNLNFVQAALKIQQIPTVHMM